MRKLFIFMLVFSVAFANLLLFQAAPAKAEVTVSAVSDSVYLSDIPYESGKTGYGSIKMDKSVDGNNLKLLGADGVEKQYAKGIGVHANSELIYNVENQGYQYFEAKVGIDREVAAGAGSVKFQVFLDNVEVTSATTSVLTRNSAEVAIKVDITGAKKVKLVANDSGNGNASDHSDWCDAKFVYPTEILTQLKTFTLTSSKSWLNVNETVQLQAVGKLYNGLDAESSSITYASSNENVARVSSAGFITAVADGIAQITATAISGTVTKTAVVTLIVGTGTGNYDSAWLVKSPDNKINVLVYVNAGYLKYKVFSDGKSVLNDSPMGIKLSDIDFTSGLTFKTRKDSAINETYSVVSGRKSNYTNNANESTFTFTKNGSDLDIIVRAYNDGMAFRYAIGGTGTKVVATESTGFQIPEGSKVIAQPYIHYYENPYNSYDLNQLQSGEYGSIFLYHTPNDVWALLSEAELNGTYSGSSIKPTAGGLMNFNFTSKQANDGPVTITLPFQSPWRAAVIGTTSTIAESNLIENLNPPSKIADTSWIKPGISSWTWLNGDSTSDRDTYLRYIDFSAEMGWQYTLLDEGWQASGAWPVWMDDLVAYGRQKNVGIFVWSHYNKLDTPSERQVLAQWAAKGIKGIKVDYFESESQSQLQIYDAIAQAALDNHLLVNFHGANKPSGERRTYPNIITREAVRGAENGAAIGNVFPTASDNSILPFTRGVVGAFDYTPLITHYKGTDYQTYAQFVALPVIFEGGVTSLADKPDRYRASKAYDFFKSLPATWDDTKVLEGDPGNYVTTARKSGDNWFVGGITDQAKTSNITLNFLGEGQYYATLYKDGASSEDINVQVIEVNKTSNLQIPMSLHGGYAIKITKTMPSVPTSITLNQTQATVEQNQTLKLTAQVMPSDATFNAVNWSSNNSAVATVDANGLVTGKAPGTVIITAATVNGKVATCTVTVPTPLTLGSAWSVVRENLPTRSVSADGKLSITTQLGDLYNNTNNAKNITLTTSRTSDFTVTTRLTFSPSANYESAGLIAYVDDNNYFMVTRRFHNGLGNKVFGLVNEVGGSAAESAVADPLTASGTVYLKLQKSASNLTGYFSADGQTWTQISGVKANTALGNASNLKVGVFAQKGGSSSAPDSPAVFESFKLNDVLVPFANANKAPVASQVMVTGTAKSGETLTGSYTFTDENSDSEGASTYQWMIADTVNGNYTEIVGASAKTLAVSDAMVGKFLQFKVTPVDQNGMAGTPVLSNPTSAVESKTQAPQATLNGLQQVNSGQTFNLKIGLTGVTQSVYQQLYAQDLTLKYDPASVQFDSVTSLIEGFHVFDPKETAPGYIRIVAASEGVNVPAQGDLLTIKFTAKSVTQATNTTISVDHVKIANEQGNELQIGGSSREMQITVSTIPVDKTLLNALISSAQAKYTAAVEGDRDGQYVIGSKSQLQSAINTASATASNSNATQQQVNSAKAALEAAVQVFESKKITADINGGGTTIGDLAMVAGAYGTQQGQAGWNEKADVNHDGKVDLLDLAIVARAILQ